MQLGLLFCCTAFVARATLYTGGDDDYYYVDQQMAAQEDEAAASQAQNLAHKVLDFIKPRLLDFVKRKFNDTTELTYDDLDATCALGLTSCQLDLYDACLLNPPDFREEAKCIVKIGNLSIKVGSLLSGGISAAWKGLTGWDLGQQFTIDLMKMTNVTLSVQSYSGDRGTNIGTLMDQISSPTRDDEKVKEDVAAEVDGKPSYKVTGYVGIDNFNIELRTSWIGAWLGDKHADEVKLFDEEGQCGKIMQQLGHCEDNVRDPESYSFLGMVWAVLKFIIRGDVKMIGSSAL